MGIKEQKIFIMIDKGWNIKKKLNIIETINYLMNVVGINVFIKMVY